MTDMPAVYFYIPERQFPVDNMPHSPDEYWEWMAAWGSRYGRGKYDWTLQTYLHLKVNGFQCELIGTIPAKGIVIAHRDFFLDNLKPSPGLLLVCIKVDREAHPYAQLQIVQNPDDEICQRSQNLWQSYCIPFWLQPGLIKRDSSRQDKFENAAFYGVTGTLAPELQDPSWEERLKNEGLRWEVVSSDRWHDYSQTDVIVAVRSFDGQTHNLKPPSKLINAWHAGIPCVLGGESAYRKLRKSELDYIEVNTVDEAIAAIVHLRENPKLRDSMIENGKMRAEETGNASLTARWCNFLTDVATPAYYRWCNASNSQRQIFLLRREIPIKMKSLQLRTSKFLSRIKIADEVS